MSTTVPTLHGAIRAIVDAARAELHVLLPGRVVAVSDDGRTVDVQPEIDRVIRADDGSTSTAPYPVINRCPIAYPRGGGWRITWPLEVGDKVELAFAERDLDAWLASGREAPPGSSRMHHLSDAIVRPGLSWLDPSLPSIGRDLVLGREDGSGEIRLSADGSIRLGSRDGAAAPVARSGDAVTIDSTTDPAFYLWLGLAPTARAPYTAPISAKISSGSGKVSST